jgi:hypothetical protein
MVRCERFAWPQLCFADHPLVAVTSMLYPIAQLLPFDRQKPLDRVSTWGNVPFKAIGDQIDRLSDFEFVMCHATSRATRRRQCRRPIVLISDCAPKFCFRAKFRLNEAVAYAAFNHLTMHLFLQTPTARSTRTNLPPDRERRSGIRHEATRNRTHAYAWGYGRIS